MPKQNLAGISNYIFQGPLRLIKQAFLHGIDNDLITHGGLLPGTGSVQTIQEESATQNYDIGARLQLKDGRVFRYCQAGAAITNSLKGCVNANKPYEGDRPATAYAVGDTEITIPAISTGNSVVNNAVNAYARGLIWFQMTPHQTHGVLSNTVTVSTEQILTLKEPLTAILPASSSGGDTMWVTLWRNPYSNVRPATAGMESVVCKPVIRITVDYYFWGQTGGPAMFVAGATPPGKTSLYRETVFASDGSILDASAGAVGHQRAGYVMSKTTASDGDQLVMLELDP